MCTRTEVRTVLDIFLGARTRKNHFRRSFLNANTSAGNFSKTRNASGTRTPTGQGQRCAGWDKSQGERSRHEGGRRSRWILGPSSGSCTCPSPKLPRRLASHSRRSSSSAASRASPSGRTDVQGATAVASRQTRVTACTPEAWVMTLPHAPRPPRPGTRRCFCVFGCQARVYDSARTVDEAFRTDSAPPLLCRLSLVAAHALCQAGRQMRLSRAAAIQ
jgi:hypothetical protein